jgi:hypothetical protein
MAHNNQIVNGRVGREMEKEIEEGDHKGNNGSIQWDVACMGLGKRGNRYVNKQD